jgi:cytidylate kinase
MAIVTISHEIGAGGPEIGQQLAERLGCRYVDHELISNAATRYGLLEEKLSHLDESKPSLFERFDAETRRYITVIQTALYDFAEQDNVVLMGRGGQWLLRGIPHVLRVRVMAPFDVRVKRLTKKLAGPMGEQTNPRTVTELVRRDDAEKAGRMRYLYEVSITDPSLYDLVINTEKLSTGASVGLLAGVVGQPELATTPASAQLVADRSLASRVTRRRASTASRWRPGAAWSPSRAPRPWTRRWTWRGAWRGCGTSRRGRWTSRRSPRSWRRRSRPLDQFLGGGPGRRPESSGTSAIMTVTSIFCFLRTIWSVTLLPTRVSATSRCTCR